VGVTYGQMRSIKGRSRGHAGLFTCDGECCGLLSFVS
jgi:hypothetical protein